jgi:hypothetical protein
MLATLGGIPNFASIVYRFHLFNSKSFTTSGLKLNASKLVPFPNTAILRPAFTCPYLLSHRRSMASASSGLSIWSVLSKPWGIALFFNSVELALLAK